MSETRANALVRLRDAVWRPTPASLRTLALWGVISNAAIIVSGGAVRVTKSGLGCPTWPKCTGDSLVPASNPEHSPINMAIEFGNRTLTYVLLAIAVAVYVAARRLRPHRPALTRLALVQPLGIVAQAVWGGVTVLTKLNPAVVAVHYLLSPAILIAAVTLYVRTRQGDGPARPLTGPRIRALGLALAAVVGAVLLAGTVVTGTGPHAGDPEAPRFTFGIEQVTRIHALLGWLTVLLTVALLVALHRTGAPDTVKRRTLIFGGLVLAQGLIGYVQYFTEVPAVLVVAHMLGSALLWVAVLGVVLSMRDRGSLPAGSATSATPGSSAAGTGGGGAAARPVSPQAAPAS